MKVTVYPSIPSGEIRAIASKSVAHRMLICAAFADKSTKIRCEQTNNDIEATVDCLCALGANINRNGGWYTVEPIILQNIVKGAVLPCRESGSTLRFLLPVAAAIGADCTFLMEGRLPYRPISLLQDELSAHGIQFFKDSPDTLRIQGKLIGNDYAIPGNISSQFISGLLFALSILPYNSTLTVTGELESAPYVDITLDCLSKFGVHIEQHNRTYTLSSNKRLVSPLTIEVEGDWSNAAFPLAFGAIGKGCIHITGLNDASKQGDKKIIELLEKFGAALTKSDQGYTINGSSLQGTSIDASQIPDLVPVLATIASVSKGETIIYGASRLRIKESDRLESTYEVLRSLGADISQTDDGLIIRGKEKLLGGSVNSFNDHRIAMSAAIACAASENAVVIDGAEAVNKSYPSFWNDLADLGMSVETL